MIAKHLISAEIPMLQVNGSIADAIRAMDEFRIENLPVGDGAVCLGLIAEADCRTIDNPGTSIAGSGVFIHESMVEESEHIFSVIRTMASLQVAIIPVVSSKKAFLGAIAASSLLPGIARLTASENPGGIIVLEINERDYNLTEISQIVEANDARILSLFLTTFPDSTRVEVTLKVNRIDIGPILQTFNRFNYLVNASWSKEDAYHDGLYERYDSLMNYLNI